MLPADDVGMENPVHEHHDDCNTPYRSVKYGFKCLAKSRPSHVCVSSLRGAIEYLFQLTRMFKPGHPRWYSHQEKGNSFTSPLFVSKGPHHLKKHVRN